ncbi:MAG: thiamine pyrophosphate-requiring protein [Peptococcaceae bacterium]|jgi:acetolactate synthase-1/2/3 large subunit|nr:thiamine pyrophosphate-requiring protein [Peptococcaceae bacterium]
MSNHIEQESGYTAADALNDALVKAGVTHVFLNSGTDYPPIIESWAKYEALGLKKPEIIISPHETVAISAAQGFAQATGQPQAVFVHVDVGTQNLGGALHNAYRCRVPVFILAGLSPFTIEGELKGGRDSYIQFIQNAADQGGIVRGYTKLNAELKSGKNIQQMVYRALQIAKSEPRGPVYLMAARDVLEEDGIDIDADLAKWAPIAPMGLDNESVDLLADALVKAKNPLIITSYLGRNTEAVGELVRLSERLAIPVSENSHPYLNFPSNHPMHVGAAQPLLKEADLVFAIDCDLPWTPAMTKLREDCRVFYLDVDPIKEDIPVWYIPSERFMRADSYTALKQINAKLDQGGIAPDLSAVSARREKFEKMRAETEERAKAAEKPQAVMTAEYISACVREIMDEDTILVNETITSGGSVGNHIPRTKPGTLYGCGGSSLGWFGGAAIGVKLAHPDKNVVALASDGVYIFSCPTAVYWMARRYKTPFLTVIYNNQGWNAPKMITKGQHPDGYAARTNKYWASFEQPARLDLVAEAAGGAFAKTVEKPEEVMAALQEGMEAVKQGVPAVINMILPPV